MKAFLFLPVITTVPPVSSTELTSLHNRDAEILPTEVVNPSTFIVSERTARLKRI